MRRILLCLLLGAVACDPAGPPPVGAPGSAVPGADREALLGAPAQGLPDTVAGVLAEVSTTALEWQDDPVLAEIDAGLDDSGALDVVRLTYVAAESERVLEIEATDAGASQQRTTLSTLGIPPDPDVPDELPVIDLAGIEAIPPLPDGLLEPADLVAAGAEALTACDVDPTALRYATGAPWSWDGTAWTQELVWSVTATQDDRFALLDPTTGAATGAVSCGQL